MTPDTGKGPRPAGKTPDRRGQDAGGPWARLPPLVRKLRLLRHRGHPSSDVRGGDRTYAAPGSQLDLRHERSRSDPRQYRVLGLPGGTDAARQVEHRPQSEQHISIKPLLMVGGRAGLSKARPVTAATRPPTGSPAFSALSRRHMPETTRPSSRLPEPRSITG